MVLLTVQMIIPSSMNPGREQEMIQQGCLRRRHDRAEAKRRRFSTGIGRSAGATVLLWLLVVGCQHAAPAGESTPPSDSEAGRLTGFVSIPFGAPLDKVDETIMQRPGVRVLQERRSDAAQWIRYGDPHYRGYPVRYSLCAGENGFYLADIWFGSFTASSQEVTDQFRAVANDLGREYGRPQEGQGELIPPAVADPDREVSLGWYFAIDGDPKARQIVLDVRHLENAKGEIVPILHMYVLDNTRLPGKLKASLQERAASDPPRSGHEQARVSRDEDAGPTGADVQAAEGGAAAESAPPIPEQPVIHELHGFLGVPFGSRADYTKRVLLARPGVVDLGPAEALADLTDVAVHGYLEPDFAGHGAVYELHFFQDRLIKVNVVLINGPGTAAHTRQQFNSLRRKLTIRYGPAHTVGDGGAEEPGREVDVMWTFDSPMGYAQGQRVRLILDERVGTGPPRVPIVTLIYSDMHLRHLAADALEAQAEAP